MHKSVQKKSIPISSHVSTHRLDENTCRFIVKLDDDATERDIERQHFIVEPSQPGKQAEDLAVAAKRKADADAASEAEIAALVAKSKEDAEARVEALVADAKAAAGAAARKKAKLAEMPEKACEHMCSCVHAYAHACTHGCTTGRTCGSSGSMDNL